MVSPFAEEEEYYAEYYRGYYGAQGDSHDCISGDSVVAGSGYRAVGGGGGGGDGGGRRGGIFDSFIREGLAW